MTDITRRYPPGDGPGRPSRWAAEHGQMVGPYVLLEPLGKGGLGEVWLAQRAAGDHRPEVAIKLIPGRDLGDPEIARRFDRERRILSALDHPDIARLLDAGRFGPGWPFLVMERVKGLPLDQAAGPMVLRERLRLFVRICRAVQYAHRRLVIHRDLKPSNILVTDQGEPRLLDFNTAKMLEAEEDVDLTRACLPMTPRYASPEQIQGQPLTTASDLYALGVILYELLVDTSPYGVNTTSDYDLSRAICEALPEPPSRLGIGDRSLDAIVQRCLHKNAEKRFPSADALADDLEAWLDRRPVSARPISRFERLGLMCRRNPIASALVSGLVALVIGASGLFFWQMQEARAERDVALAVTEFLESLFTAADPGSTEFSGEDLFQILDERSQALIASPPEDSRIAGRLMAALGTVQANFGRSAEAARLFEASWDAVEDMETLVRWANARLETGDAAGADQLFQRAYDHRRGLTAPMQAFLGASYAQLEVSRGEIDRALLLAEEAAAVAPQGSVDEVYAIDTLAQIHFHAGAMESASRAGERALIAAIAFYGEPHLQVATSRNNLALYKGRLGQDAEALLLLEQASEDFEQLLGPDDPRLATTYSNLGSRRSQQGQFSDALQDLEKAMDLTRRHYGDEHPWVGLIHGYFGQTYQRMGQLEEAERSFSQALAVVEEEPRFRARLGIEAVLNHILLDELETARSELSALEGDIEDSYPIDHPRRTRLLEVHALVSLLELDYPRFERVMDQLVAADGAEGLAIELLRIHADARSGRCNQAVSGWAVLPVGAELKRAALFRTARSALDSFCA